MYALKLGLRRQCKRDNPKLLEKEANRCFQKFKTKINRTSNKVWYQKLGGKYQIKQLKEIEKVCLKKMRRGQGFAYTYLFVFRLVVLFGF